MAAEKLYSGTVLRLDQVGLGIIVANPTDADLTEKEYPFTFDKIQGYKGEPVNDLGLSEGAGVEFTLDENGRVSMVTPEPRAQGKKRVLFGLDKLFSREDKVF